MDNVLIPIAIDIATGKRVDVADVANGADCGCVCQSCEIDVVAKQGDLKAWHFAHNPHSQRKAVRVCDVSFYSSAKVFIRQLFLEGLINAIKTPDFILQGLHGATEVVTKSQSVTNFVVDELSPLHITLSLGAHKLHLYFRHRENVSDLDTLPPENGVLAIHLDHIEDAYFNSPSKRTFTETITQFFESGDAGKEWLYHPKLNSAKQQLLIKENNLRPAFITSRQMRNFNESLAKRDQELVTGKLSCPKCKHEWKGRNYWDIHVKTRFKKSTQLDQKNQAGDRKIRSGISIEFLCAKMPNLAR
ncbi:competence protein CoiA family protein [Simiduia curdlanivorans]|uniref:Competence protein CoiA family protein n=1 Tax=Simiduia curdlanivorans TaxID=1492769 RepID=A0ABV8V116_9GAMM|nr:competence protein CoiA family protein [Simiduia curdlanivorans]MDN3637571.1 competence protein CoiA family protein [Simiduia curdlanivorans]